MLHLLVHSEAGIESYSVEQLFGKIQLIVNFFYKIGVSFQYSLLNKKVYKFIKSKILHSSILQFYRATRARSLAPSPERITVSL